jgi:N-acetylglucosaminyldiphosphoundecaprenol N-acetyl-beta-D-mannosaminyltransferase
VSVRLLGLDFAALDVAAAAARIAQQPADAPFRYVVTPNADHLVRLARHPELQAAYAGAWLRLLDSRVVARAARLLGLTTPPVAPGSDLTALLLAGHLKSGERVTIVGLRSARLPELIRRYRLDAVAHNDPPIGFENDRTAFQAAISFVLAHPARFTFLAVGSPRQEMLAAAIAATGQARGIGLCVGASLDFLSGAVPRAPAWMCGAGLEWLYRLASDPRRLAWRYLVQDPAVFALLFREWRRLRAG